MREGELLVDPRLGLGVLLGSELPRREHHLALAPVDRVAVDIAVGVLIRTQRLALAQRVMKRPPIPQADVFEQRLVIGEIDAAVFLDRKVHVARAVIQPVSRAGGFDMALDVRLLEHQLVGTHVEASNQRWQEPVDG